MQLLVITEFEDRVYPSVSVAATQNRPEATVFKVNEVLHVEMISRKQCLQGKFLEVRYTDQRVSFFIPENSVEIHYGDMATSSNVVLPSG